MRLWRGRCGAHTRVAMTALSVAWSRQHDFVASTAGQPRAEFLIPEVVDELIKSGEAKVRVLTSEDRWYGVTYKEDKPMVVDAFKKLLADEVYPNRLW